MCLVKCFSSVVLQYFFLLLLKAKGQGHCQLGNPLVSMVTVTAGCDCVNFLSWLQRCRGNPGINVRCFGVLSAMSLLTPPPLLVKSGQWKLFLASVCQAPPRDYLRSSRLCLENVFSLGSIEASSVQKPACDAVRIPTAVYKQNLFTSTGLCFWQIYYVGASCI